MRHCRAERDSPQANRDDFSDGNAPKLGVATKWWLATSSVASATAARTFGFRPGFVHIDGAPAQLRAVESGDGFFSFFCVRHFHKREPARTPGFTIRQNAYTIYLPIRLEHFSKLVFRGVEAEITDEDVFHGAALSVREPGETLSKQKAVVPRFAKARRV